MSVAEHCLPGNRGLVPRFVLLTTAAGDDFVVVVHYVPFEDRVAGCLDYMPAISAEAPTFDEMCSKLIEAAKPHVEALYAAAAESQRRYEEQAA